MRLLAIVLGMLLVVVGCSAATTAPVAHYDIRSFGAVADGTTKSTQAIQKAIDAAASHGGGTVYVPAGKYLTGPIRLKSNIRLELDAGAVLKFSQEFDDYLPMVRVRWEGTEVKTFSPFIYGVGVENVAIVGRGLIDGQGEPWWQFYKKLRAEHEKTGAWNTTSKWQRDFFKQNAKLERPDDPVRLDSGFLRPPLIQFLDAKNVSIRDITLKNSPFWTINPAYCDGLTVSGVTIENPDSAPNTDGINPDSCRNVHISDSQISVGDDCITIKSGRDAEGRRIARPAENYVITNCTMRRGHGGVVIGSEMSGGVKKIAISNCVFDGTDRGIRIKSTRGRGGVVEDVRVSNVLMKGIREEAITLNLFYTQAPPEPVSARTPKFANIHFNAITAQAEQAATLLGLPESPLENVSLSDVNIVANKGIVIADAKDIRLHAVRVDVATGRAVSAERTDRLVLFDVGPSKMQPGVPPILLVDVSNAFVRGPLARVGAEPVLEVRGPSSRSIALERDSANAKPPVLAGDLPRDAVTVAATWQP